MDLSSPESSLPPTRTHSTTSSLSLSSTLLDEQDEDVKMAVRALGDMRNNAQSLQNLGRGKSIYNERLSALSIPSSSAATPSLPSPTLSSVSSIGPSTSAASGSSGAVDAGFVGRMSHLPILNTALRVYEQGKSSSRVVKYGAEMMESGVKTISRPVIDRLPVNVGQLDEFACRQLDRLNTYRRPSGSTERDRSPSSPHRDLSQSRDVSMRRFEDELSEYNEGGVHDTYTKHDEEKKERERRERSPLTRTKHRGSGVGVDKWLEGTSAYSPTPGPGPGAEIGSGSRSSTPVQRYQPLSPSSEEGPRSVSPDDRRISESGTEEQQVAQRSRWHSVLLEAGGLSAALSDESMRRLKYCLGWLQYATAHIDAQILLLRDLTASLQQQAQAASTPTTPTASSTAANSDPSTQHLDAASRGSSSISQDQYAKLTHIRQDIVHTVRQVVDVMSKYAGGKALPEPARKRVKAFILTLPRRWAVAAGVAPTSSASDASGGVSRGSHSRAPSGSGIGGVEERERDSVTAAAGGRAGSERRKQHHYQRERGVGSPVSSRAVSPGASPRAGTISLGSRSGGSAASGAAVPGPPTVMPSVGQVSEQSQAQRPRVSATTAMVAAQRCLALATESLDMMRGVTGVVKDSLDRADAWVGRFKSVGIQRGADGMAEGEGGEIDAARLQQYRLRDDDMGRGEGDRDSEHGGREGSVDFAFNPNSRSTSRRGSMEYPPSSPYPSSLPSTPGATGFVLPPLQMPVDAPSPGMGVAKMKIGETQMREAEAVGRGGQGKGDEREDGKMDVDE